VIERKWEIPDLAFAYALTYQPGVRIRDTKWGGQYVGTVNRVDADGELHVTWDGQFGEHQMSPSRG
jgi:hypothetical protein